MMGALLLIMPKWVAIDGAYCALIACYSGVMCAKVAIMCSVISGDNAYRAC